MPDGGGRKVLARVLPTAVTSCEAWHDADPASMHPDEAEAVALAVPARQREFATGRACARAALVRLGTPVLSLPRTSEGAPLWPPGVVGSITHCVGYRAAAVARARDIAALGIDAEPHLALPPELATQMARQSIPSGDAWRWDRIAFSAVESTAKAWWSVSGDWVDLLEIRVVVDPDGTFSASLPDVMTPPWWTGRGRWIVARDTILTAVALECVDGG